MTIRISKEHYLPGLPGKYINSESFEKHSIKSQAHPVRGEADAGEA
jgi:hypothetical protein